MRWTRTVSRLVKFGDAVRAYKQRAQGNAEPIRSPHITELIQPAFKKLNANIDHLKPSHVWLKGGRGSTKSSYVALKITKGMMLNSEANAVVFRKVGDTLRDSVAELYWWAIKQWKAEDYWHLQLSPLKLIYHNPNTGSSQEIRFKGADKPKKIKSQAFSFGYLKYIHYEEADEFLEQDEFDTINLSLMRGSDEDVTAFYSYNPPKHRGHWLNSYIYEVESRPDTIVNHSDYTTVPREWLGKTFLTNAEIMAERQPNRYKHVYLGLDVNTGLEVFDNIEIRELTEDDLTDMDGAYEYGCDFGYGGDPFVYLKTYYNSRRGILYILDEFWGYGASNRKCVEAMGEIDPGNQYTNADSAEPRTIAEFEELGRKMWPVKKGPGSVDHGVKWLQDLVAIVIVSSKCPNTAKEFNEYALEERDGKVRAGYPDKNNHSIDTARYAMEDNIRAGKWLV